MTEQWKSKVALFFAFTLIEESLSVVAIKDALLFLGRRFPGRVPDDIHLVEACLRYFKKYAKKRTHPSQNPTIFADSSAVDFSAWLIVSDRLTDDSLTTLVLSKILRISDEDIAIGIGQSQGTIRYRISQALNLLGSEVRGCS